MARSLGQLSVGEQETLFVSSDGLDARLTAGKEAARLGFTGTALAEIDQAVAVLVANLERRLVVGAVTLRRVEGEEGVGLEIQCVDKGSGMVDTEFAPTQRHSRLSSLGNGFETINHTMDEVELSSNRDVGTRILCRRWLKPPAEIARETRRWEFGAATRARGFDKFNGDAYLVRVWRDKLLVALIDGLGHGEAAELSASAAQASVNTLPELPLAKIFENASRACKSTRGVVMTVVRFDSPSQLSFAGVGNVEARAITPSESVHFRVLRGIVGAGDPHASVKQLAWDPAGLLVMHTDGLTAKWHWSSFKGLLREPCQSVARRFLYELGSTDDDSTVLALRSWRV